MSETEKSTRPAPRAFDRAVKLLATRAHFREELRQKLLRKGHANEEVEDALARLAALGQLDDAKLATEEAGRLRARKGLARRGVAAELRRKGAAGEAIDGALAEPADEAALALDAAHRWMRSHRRDPAALARHLDRKGYGRGEIVRVLRELELEDDAAALGDDA